MQSIGRNFPRIRISQKTSSRRGIQLAFETNQVAALEPPPFFLQLFRKRLPLGHFSLHPIAPPARSFLHAIPHGIRKRVSETKSDEVTHALLPPMREVTSVNSHRFVGIEFHEIRRNWDSSFFEHRSENRNWRTSLPTRSERTWRFVLHLHPPFTSSFSASASLPQAHAAFHTRGSHIYPPIDKAPATGRRRIQARVPPRRFPQPNPREACGGVSTLS